MWNCFGRRRGEDREPLLPQYANDTVLQRELHQKLHTYQMVRAISNGFMPSTEQTIVNLRTLLAADFFQEDNFDLSDSGRLLLRYSKRFIEQLITFLRNKNEDDQLQDVIWHLTKARISLDTDDLARRTSIAKSRANTKAGETLRQPDVCYASPLC